MSRRKDSSLFLVMSKWETESTVTRTCCLSGWGWWSLIFIGSTPGGYFERCSGKNKVGTCGENLKSMSLPKCPDSGCQPDCVKWLQHTPNNCFLITYSKIVSPEDRSCKKNKCSGVVQNGSFSFPPARSFRKVFSTIHCENLAELLEVKLTKNESPMTVSSREFLSLSLVSNEPEEIHS